MPDGLRFWSLTVPMLPLLDRSSAAPLKGTAHACLTCGLVWMHVEPERLRTVLRNAGTQATRERFAGRGSGDPSSS
jgi:hypothetical protein